MGPVIIDLDGTLLDTERVYRNAFMTAITAVGFSIPEPVYDSLVGLPSGSRGTLLRRHLGDNFPWSACLDLYYTCRARLLATEIPLMPGALELLDWLDDRGLQKAVATSASRATAVAHLMQAGLFQRFATVITRDDVVRCKPDPEALLKAATGLRSSPHHCFVIEDSLPGVRSALAAGMRAIWVGKASNVPTLPPKVQAASTLNHVRALLEDAPEPALGCNVQSAA